jgi:UDP-glucose 4-epimerase
MNILVIGSKGFIGHSLYSYFSKKNTCYGVDVAEDTVDSKYFKVAKINPDYKDVFEKLNIDICINASGAANVSASISDTLNDFELNVVNVERILEAIRQTQKNCRFILLSSAAVYGNPKTLPIKETEQIEPVSPYGFHKSMAERICHMYSELFGISCYCLRIFSVYGEGLKKQVIWDITHKFLYEDRVELFGSGKETRDFIYIEDIVRSIDLIIKNDRSSFDIINIGNGEQICIADIASEVKKIMKSNKEIVFTGQKNEGNPINWEADISELKNLGYRQTVSIGDGIKRYVEWAVKL